MENGDWKLYQISINTKENANHLVQISLYSMKEDGMELVGW